MPRTEAPSAPELPLEPRREWLAALLGGCAALLPLAVGSVLGPLPHDQPNEPRVAGVVATAALLVVAGLRLQLPRGSRIWIALLVLPVAHLLLPRVSSLAGLDAALAILGGITLTLRAALRHALHPYEGPRHVALGGAAAIVALTVVPSLLPWWALSSVVLEPAIGRGVASVLAEDDPEAQSVTLETADGLALTGSYWAGSRATPPVLVVHGLGDSRVGIAPWVQAFRDAGASVLAFDMRAHGASEGVLLTYADREPDDVVIAAQALASLSGRDAAEVLPFGMSMGGGAVLAALPRLEALGIRRAVTLAPASDYPALVQTFTGSALLPLGREVLRHTAFALGAVPLTDLVPRDALARTHVRSLTYHGTADGMVPPALSRRLAELPHVEVRWLEGEGHVVEPTTDLVADMLAFAVL